MEANRHSNVLVAHVKEEPDCEQSGAGDTHTKVLLLPEHMRVKVEVEFEEALRSDTYSRSERPGHLPSSGTELLTGSKKALSRYPLELSPLASLPCPPLAPLSNPRPTPHSTDRTPVTNCYPCDVCGRVYIQKYLLIRHLLLHLKSKVVRKKYVCGTCGQRFINEVDLQNHKLSEGHTGLRKYPCRVCDQQFSSRSGLNVHKRTHKVEKPLHCDKCKKKYRKPSELRRHMRAHDERPYPCESCGKLFKTENDLSLHKTLCEICS